MRLYRPFPAERFVAALPPTVRSIAVLDRTKEPGAVGEPLYLDVRRRARRGDGPRRAAASRALPRVIGGRYGLSSKEFTPGAWSRRSSTSWRAARPKRHFTVGINDDVTHLQPRRSTPTFRYPRPAGEVQAMFFGLGSDGTVGANKAR